MKKICTIVVFAAVLAVAGVGLAQDSQSFGVQPPLAGAPVDTTPTIAQERKAEGYVPNGTGGTLVPATVRGFDPGNGADAPFGALPPLTAPSPKAQ